MEFEHISYRERTGRNSKQIETYNFHKAAAVLVEYGFDCIRLSDDWEGADFLAHHKKTNRTLKVQLKTCLVIDKKYLPNKDLYMCFPLDGTGNWYLVKHSRLKELVRENAPEWFDSPRWKKKQHFYHYTGIYKKNQAVRDALEDYAYRSCYGSLGFRECGDK